jgi:nicotinamidase-related amidase
MTAGELRQALQELRGKRDLTIAFRDVHPPANTLTVTGAMLVPEEPDHLVKLTDGQAVYTLNAEQVAWLRIGSNTTLT